MQLSPPELVAWSRTGGGRRKLRYAAASLMSAVVGQGALLVAFGWMRWSAPVAAVFAFTVGAVSSYHLSRVWVWERSGRSDLMREVVPFWIVAGATLALSSIAIVVAERYAAEVTTSHVVRTAAVMAASLASVTAMWLLKYLVLDRYVFSWGAKPAPGKPGR